MMRYGGGRYAEFGVGSITYAMKARSALDAAGIQSDVTRLDPAKTPMGCAWGIRVNAGAAAGAERTMRSAGIVSSVITRPSG